MSVLGDRHRVLEVRRSTPVARHDRPPSAALHGPSSGVHIGSMARIIPAAVSVRPRLPKFGSGILVQGLPIPCPTKSRPPRILGLHRLLHGARHPKTVPRPHLVDPAERDRSVAASSREETPFTAPRERSSPHPVESSGRSRNRCSGCRLPDDRFFDGSVHTSR